MKIKIKQYLLLLLIVVSTQCLRHNCYNPPNDYAYHMKDSTDHGSQVIQGPMTNEAFYFNGQEQYRSFETTNLGGDISVSFWARWDQLNSWSRIIDFGNGAGQDVLQISNEGRSNNFTWETFNQGNQRSQVQGQVELDIWNHYVVTIDQNGQQSIYVNGQQEGSLVIGSNQSIPQMERRNNYIGKSNWADEYFQGGIDELMVFDRLLDYGEITCLADVCVDSCSNTCSSNSLNCNPEFQGMQVVHNQCQLPNNPILEQLQGVKQGEEVKSIPGPVSNDALVFQGHNYVEFDPILIGGDLSFCLWNRFDSSNYWQRLFDFGNGDQNYNILAGQHQTTNDIGFHIYEIGQEKVENRSENTFDTGVWHHWCFTSDQYGHQQIFRDGQLQLEQQNAYGIHRVLRSNNYLGKSNWQNDSNSHSTVDGFQVFTRVIKNEEIQCMAEECPVQCSNGAEKCAKNSQFCENPLCVTFYSEKDFQGESIIFCDNDNQEQVPGVIASVQIPEGVQISLYNGKGFEGRVAFFTKDVASFDDIDWSDQNQQCQQGVYLLGSNSYQNANLISKNQKHLKKQKQDKKSNLKGSQ